MSERLYSRLTNASMLIGVASALLFDSGRFPHVVVGTIGIIAGVAATVLYFWNQHYSSSKIESSAKEVLRASGVRSEAVKFRDVRFALSDKAMREVATLTAAQGWKRNAVAAVWRPNLGLDAEFPLDEIAAYRREKARLWLSYYAAHHARTLQWHVVKDANLALMKPEVELSPNEVAACAIEIMHNLAIADKFNQWEYVLGPKGLRVSVKKAHSLPRPVSQEDFEFEQISAMIK